MLGNITEITINQDRGMIRVAMVKNGAASINKFKTLPQAAKFLRDHAGIILRNVKIEDESCPKPQLVK